MKTRVFLVSALLDSAYATLRENIEHLTLAEALFVPPGG